MTAAVVVLVSLPALMSVIFWRSEKALEKWLGTKLDKDIDLLQISRAANSILRPRGAYLQSLEGTFDARNLGRHALLPAAFARS